MVAKNGELIFQIHQCFSVENANKTSHWQDYSTLHSGMSEIRSVLMWLFCVVMTMKMGAYNTMVFDSVVVNP